MIAGGPLAIVFDMDGVLIDSEPLWRRAEIACFGEVGVRLVDSDCRATQGLRIDAVVAYWFERRPWSGVSNEAMAQQIVDRVEALIRAEGEPMPGSAEAIATARRLGCRLALASSSSMQLIRAVLNRFGWTEVFEILCSAEHEARGKPAPDVYVAALRALGVAPQEALAIEDSINGVRSAKSAGLRCIAVPDAESAQDPRFAEADFCFANLTEVAAALPQLARASAEPV
jgi:HAD superfamily hydrolase (TIGR01509 family)